MTATTTTEPQRQWLNTPDPVNVGESIHVVTARWRVRGPHGGDHDFTFIQTAEVLERAIRHENIIRYYKDGDLKDDIKWGHDLMYAYNACKFEQVRPNAWHGELLTFYILANELPCCGGRFVKDHESLGYSTVVYGHCDFCSAKWTRCDGSYWTLEK